MNYSHSHHRFANWLKFYPDINEQDVLEHPENYLGPNYKEVLNFWFYWDSLSDEQWEIYEDRYWELDDETLDQAHCIAGELASEIIDPRFVDFFDYYEREILAAHLCIERGIPFTFLPLIFDL